MKRAAPIVLCIAAGAMLTACIKPNVEPMTRARYYIDNRTDSALALNVEALYDNADLLTDSLPAQTITAIDDVVQGSGGHVLPSNFYRTFAVTFVDSLGNTVAVYSGVHNEDWERITLSADRTELMMVID